jgi:hypothetical protein
VSPPIIQLYSNPHISFNGHATGVDPALDPANAAHAARGLNDMAMLIATFREPPVPASESASETDAVARPGTFAPLRR